MNDPLPCLLAMILTPLCVAFLLWLVTRLESTLGSDPGAGATPVDI